MTNLQQAVKRDLAYFEIFNYHPSQEEIYRYLIGYQCPFSDLAPFVKSYPKKQVSSSLLLDKVSAANRLAVLASKFPGVRAIFLTGDLAAGSAKAGSDVDFLVVTCRGWLPVARWGLTVFFSLLGLRRSHFSLAFTKTAACFNVFLEEYSLSMPKGRRNLFVAQEIARVKPLVDKDRYYEKLLASNSWVFDFLPNFSPSAQPIQGVFRRSASKNAISGPCVFAVEGLQALLSKLLLTGKPGSAGKTSLGGWAGAKQLFLHPKDLTSWVLMEYKKNCQGAGVNPGKLHYET